MEAIFLLAAILFFVCPLVALFVAFSARNKATAAEQAVQRLKSELARLRAEFGQTTAADKPAPAQSAPATAINPAPQNTESSTVFVTPGTRNKPNALEPAKPAPVPIPAQTPPIRPDTRPENTRPAAPPGPVTLFVSGLADKARQWLFGGNLVAKIGLLILFIGISFLLKYAAAHVVVPIEFRLAGIVLADIGLLVWGWRIRETRAGISLPVQGAALAILMLVTFAAFRMYDLIPGGMAFGLLFVLTAFTCLLAVLQNALWLAIFGIAGGFVAPILTSTGHGSHIALFSYYALLNAGIFGIALKRAWRSLNLIGFVFTFVIGSAWGVLRYVPENYLSAQLFLILFFLFYVAIAIVYASRQAPQLKHYVDATLVFGTPLVAFGLQYGLVKHIPFALAFSALATGLFYMGLTLLLWRRRGSTLKLLAESFFALGIVFGTLAIPFALDGRWTSAAWALEGAGIVWVGLRQRQTLAWVFGLLVQAGAWISFIFSISGLDPVAATHSSLWLGFLLLAATAFLMATNFRAQAGNDGDISRYRFGSFATVFLALASLWFVAGAWVEIWLRTSGATRATLLSGSALVTAIGLGLIARRMQWQMARHFALVVQVIAGVTLLVLAMVQLGWPLQGTSANLLAGPFFGALLIGAGAFFSSWVFHRQQQTDPQAGLHALSRGLLLWSGFWWYGMVLYLLADWVAAHYQISMQIPGYRGNSLWASAYGIGLAVSSPLFARLARRLKWQDLRWSAIPAWSALALATGMVLAALYRDDRLPSQETWVAWLALWLAGEYLLRFGQNNNGWTLPAPRLKLLHAVRTAGPWLMIWPLGNYWISAWLQGGSAQPLPAESGWFTSGSWGRYLPAWVMMLAIGWLMQRSRSGKWPVAPIGPWYQRRLIPLATGWAIALVVLWNLTQNGSMAPLPYLPLLNPLDLSTCFAILLGIATYRLLHADPDRPHSTVGTTRVLYIAGLAAYGWFNLVLLRSVSHYLDIPYRFDAMFASQFVQAMLSLVWSATALILMRRAAKHISRNQWLAGAALLGAVVMKLFFVDLSNVGGVERIISFVGVGLLMVAIGYLAPYPVQPAEDDAPPPGAAAA